MSEKKIRFPEISLQTRLMWDLFFLLVLAVIVYLVAGQFDILERIVAFAHQYEEWELDELLIVSFVMSGVLAVYFLRQWFAIFKSQREVAAKNSDLQKALAEIKRLKGILPICTQCKKIKDEKGHWNHLEAYIEKHSEADFSHSICPECARELYPDIFEDDE